uniref:non-specific serine/threonine protein kinase n=1 Tax=Oryza nivara TaxID=4536 RepID=A0A0E0J9X2_ORYNI
MTMKVTTATAHFLLVFLASTISHSVICSALGNETDQLSSLLEFKNAISLDPEQSLISWNSSNHLWEGVSCSSKNPPRVTAIDLSHQGLVGRISPSLGNLTFLRNLSLATNRFTGQIPASLGRLRRLRSLYLSNNTLQGTIPSFANCSELRALFLDGNELAGVLPGAGDLPVGIEALVLSSNRLAGTIPPSLGNVTTLRKLACMNNGVGGGIPGELAALRGMEVLAVDGNRLSGGFPVAVMNMSGLAVLGLSTNGFTGELPSGIGGFLPKLRQLTIGGNFFQGNIPSSLANASNLFKLGMSDNNFTGVVPASIGKLAKLTLLNLEMNQLHARSKQEWEFMDNLANCTELQVLSLEKNQMEGQVPSSLGNFSVQLQYLYLGLNRLSGSFPSGIANLPNLIILALDDNWFTVSVPQWLGGLKTLQSLTVSYNNFTGCENLQHIELDHNNLSGGIPPPFGKLISLKFLNLSHNKLTGSIPMLLGDLQLLEQIDLSFNHLRGEVPTKAQRLNIVVDVSDALAYLHHNHQGPIIHCDLKPSNILLDDSMTAHVGDFGLARFKIDSKTSLGNSVSTSSFAINGTIGYVAPECAIGGQVSTAADVYSFGVVLLEIFIRKRPTDDMFKDGLSIAKYADINIPDRLLQIVDPQLVQELSLNQEDPVATDENAAHCLLSVLNIGLCCTKSSPNERISMQEVAAKLHAIRDSISQSTTSRLSRRQFSYIDGDHHNTWGSVLLDMEQRVLMEEIVTLLPVERAVATTRFVLGLLRTDMILHTGVACRDALEMRASKQLKEATHEDLLIPNTGNFVETLYDVDCMERMLEQFIVTVHELVGVRSPVRLATDIGRRLGG